MSSSKIIGSYRSRLITVTSVQHPSATSQQQLQYNLYHAQSTRAHILVPPAPNPIFPSKLSLHHPSSLSLPSPPATKSTMSRFLTSRSLRTAFSPRLHGLPASRSSRPLSTSLARQYPRKDSQDRESMNTDAAEYSKSGSDDIAAHKDVAFDSGTVKPEEALGKAEEEEVRIYIPATFVTLYSFLWVHFSGCSPRPCAIF